MGSTESTADLVYVCPACETSFEVDDDTRDALVEHTCVLCGAAVTESAFTAP
ncbi:MAG: hypothetical protein ABEJ31_06135 [Haloarculaceae archaeon]